MSFQLVLEWVHLLWFKYLSVILDPLCLFAMDCALYDSLHDLVGDKCNMPRVCENAFMSVYPHNCDDMLLESLGVIDMDLDAKLVLSNKLVDELKCENESLKMHAKCLIAKSIAKKNENICCNHVVVPDFVPIMCSTLKDKSVYIPLHKRNQKVERKAIKLKPPFSLNLRFWIDLSLFQLVTIMV